jgi:hypothetical protein
MTAQTARVTQSGVCTRTEWRARDALRWLYRGDGTADARSARGLTDLCARRSPSVSPITTNEGTSGRRLLDDLQRAGPDALDLPATLIRSAEPGDQSPWGGAGGLRLVAAYRDSEVRPADPLGQLLADLAQAGLAQHHALDPLAAEGHAAPLDVGARRTRASHRSPRC